MHDVICVGCNRRFKATNPRAKWCTPACRTRTKRVEAKAAQPVGGKAESELVAAVRDELGDKAETVDGQIALVLAKQVVVAKGSAASTLAKELRQVIDRATGGVTPTPAGEPQPEDELERARRRVREQRQALGSS